MTAQQQHAATADTLALLAANLELQRMLAQHLAQDRRSAEPQQPAADALRTLLASLQHDSATPGAWSSPSTASNTLRGAECVATSQQQPFPSTSSSAAVANHQGYSAPWLQPQHHVAASSLSTKNIATQLPYATISAPEVDCSVGSGPLWDLVGSGMILPMPGDPPPYHAAPCSPPYSEHGGTTTPFLSPDNLLALDEPCSPRTASTGVRRSRRTQARSSISGSSSVAFGGGARDTDATNVPASRSSSNSSGASAMDLDHGDDSSSASSGSSHDDNNTFQQHEADQLSGKQTSIRKGTEQRRRALTDKERSERAKLRMLRNRKAAQSSRDRKKQLMVSLETENKELRSKTEYLNKRIVSSQVRNKELEAMVDRLTKQLSDVKVSVPSQFLPVDVFDSVPGDYNSTAAPSTVASDGAMSPLSLPKHSQVQMDSATLHKSQSPLGTFNLDTLPPLSSNSSSSTGLIWAQSQQEQIQLLQQQLQQQSTQPSSFLPPGFENDQRSQLFSQQQQNLLLAITSMLSNDSLSATADQIQMTSKLAESRLRMLGNRLNTTASSEIPPAHHQQQQKEQVQVSPEKNFLHFPGEEATQSSIQDLLSGGIPLVSPISGRSIDNNASSPPVVDTSSFSPGLEANTHFQGSTQKEQQSPNSIKWLSTNNDIIFTTPSLRSVESETTKGDEKSSNVEKLDSTPQMGLNFFGISNFLSYTSSRFLSGRLDKQDVVSDVSTVTLKSTTGGPTTSLSNRYPVATIVGYNVSANNNILVHGDYDLAKSDLKISKVNKKNEGSAATLAETRHSSMVHMPSKISAFSFTGVSNLVRDMMMSSIAFLKPTLDETSTILDTTSLDKTESISSSMFSDALLPGEEEAEEDYKEHKNTIDAPRHLASTFRKSWFVRSLVSNFY